MGSADDRKRFVTQVKKACAHRQADARDRHPPDRRRPHRFLDRRRGLGQGPEGQHQADRRDLPRGRQGRRRITASSWSPRARSAGAACTRWRREREPARDGRHARRRRLPGRHGAFDAVHAGLQRREGPPAARRTSTGRTRPRSTRPTRRSPMRSARGPTTSTSPRTTARSSARATTRRPAATARSTIRTASSISPKHAGYWLRDDKGELTKKMRHICWDGCMFPNAVMEKQETWNDDSGRDDQGARRARLARIGAADRVGDDAWQEKT